MGKAVLARDTSKISASAARVAITASVAVIVLLASLHVLSPEFDPAWRLVSEYATGQYGWVLSLMFMCWGVSSWALCFAIWSEVRTTAGKVGLAVLVAAMIVMIVGYTQAGNRLATDVIAVVGYPNRLGVVLNCVWVIMVARQALLLRGRSAPNRFPTAASPSQLATE